MDKLESSEHSGVAINMTKMTEDIGITSNVKENEFQPHRDIPSEDNPFYISMFSPQIGDVLESEELNNKITKVEDEFRLHRNNEAFLNPFRLHSNNAADPNPIFESIFSSKTEYAVEIEDNDQTTKVEDEFRLHRNNEADPNPFFESIFSPKTECSLDSEDNDQTTKVEDEFRMHRDNQADSSPFLNCMFKTEMKDKARKRERNRANIYEFSSSNSGVLTKAKDEDFQQSRNTPGSLNLSFNTIFEILNNFILEDEERTKRRKIIDESDDSISSKDSISSEDSISSKDSIFSEVTISSKDSASSKASSQILNSDSEVSNLATNNEESQLSTCPTCHKACTMYEMAKFRRDYQAKAECLRFMKNMLSVDTFYDYLVLALIYDDKELLQSATGFFCRNTKEIIHRVKWQTFMREYPTQANQLYIEALHYNSK